MEVNYDLEVDVDGTSEKKLAAEETLRPTLAEWNHEYQNKDRVYQGVYMNVGEEVYQSFYTLNGGRLFIGFFLGGLFLMVTVLIVFYK